MTFVVKTFIAAVNHLLASETWARQCLLPYAGRVACLVTPFAEIVARVQADGLIAASAPNGASGGPFDVTITIPGAALPELIGGGRQTALRRVKIDGDAEFATVLSKLAKQLRWEPEEDLARLIGDVPAHRAAILIRGLRDQLQRSARNTAETVAEYLLEENPQLTRHVLLSEFSAETVRLRDTLARLEKRIERAERMLADDAASTAALPRLSDRTPANRL